MPANQGSVIGVATGYVINAKSPKLTEATQFMALLNSEANLQALIEAEVTPLALAAASGDTPDTRSAALTTLLNEAPAIVLPPDTGYDLEDGRRPVRRDRRGPGRPEQPGRCPRRDRPEAGPLTRGTRCFGTAGDRAR